MTEEPLHARIQHHKRRRQRAVTWLLQRLQRQEPVVRQKQTSRLEFMADTGIQRGDRSETETDEPSGIHGRYWNTERRP